jgi:hypothetical protein
MEWLWFGMGLLAVGIENYYRRFTFYQLYIEDYWTEKEYNANLGYDKWDIIFFGATLLFGPLALCMSVWMCRDKLGVSYRYRKWTQAEAKKLFPEDYNVKA